jgi:2-polyprenyl-6-methoxyphenol hydroxylase-like FAD-dependent oxidoreductase
MLAGRRHDLKPSDGAQFSKTLRSLSVEHGCATVTFEDGSKATGDIVIGCDGSHSKVREFLVGSEAAALQETGTTMMNFGGGVYTPEQAHLLRSFHPIVQLGVHSELSTTTLLAGMLGSLYRAVTRLLTVFSARYSERERHRNMALPEVRPVVGPTIRS